MTGPDHFEEAEACIELGKHVHGNGGDPERAALYFAEAQVHATLALTYATIVGGVGWSAWGEEDA